MADWIEYLQLVRAEGRWQIVNVLWDGSPNGRPEREARRRLTRWVGRPQPSISARRETSPCSGS